MPGYIAVVPRVVPLLKQWSFVVSQEGQQGTRVYMDAAEHPQGATLGMALPNIGDKWDANWENCLCRTISCSYDGGTEDCGRTWTLSYDSRRTDEAQNIVNQTGGAWAGTYAGLPVQVESAGEVASFLPDKHSWRWTSGSSGSSESSNSSESDESDHMDVDQSLALPVKSSTIRLSRILTLDKLDDWFAVEAPLRGRINKLAMFALNPHTVLYTGCSISDFWNPAGERQWRVELSFQHKSVKTYTVPDSDGWNWFLREKDGTWQKPYKVSDGSNVYTEADFTPLFVTGKPSISRPSLDVIDK